MLKVANVSSARDFFFIKIKNEQAGFSPSSSGRRKTNSKKKFK
jgi:hypothetical protein